MSRMSASVTPLASEIVRLSVISSLHPLALSLVSLRFCSAIHGDKSQMDRTAALEEFKSGRCGCGYGYGYVFADVTLCRPAVCHVLLHSRDCSHATRVALHILLSILSARYIHLLHSYSWSSFSCLRYLLCLEYHYLSPLT